MNPIKSVEMAQPEQEGVLPVDRQGRPVEQPLFDDDVLDGAEEIALFVYGDRTKRRRIWAHQDQLPVWKINNRLYGRKSKLRLWFEAQENAAVHGFKGESA